MRRFLLLSAPVLFLSLCLHAGNELPSSQKPDLNAGPRLRLPSIDVNVVPPLPILAKQISERASVADATEGISSMAALSAAMPRRTTPAPFVKFDLPDPYENRKAMRLPLSLPPESTEPMTAPLKPLKP